MLNTSKLEGTIFYLAIFSISLQLGKHFWPPFSFVDGIRLDYLSPTLYLSDIFIFLLFLLVVLNRPKSIVKALSKSIILILFLVSLLVSSIFAISPDTAFFWNLKVIEVIFFTWYVSRFVFSKEKIVKFFDVLLLAGVIQSVIAFFQFVLQKSIGGPLYFMGERSFDVQTIGIATFFTGGKEVLRPYGTFPHPNVLALFLSIVFVFCVHYVLNNRNTKRAYVYAILLFIIALGLLLTASRLIILLTIIASLIVFIKQKKHIIYLLVLFMALIPIYLTIFSGRFLSLNPILEAAQVRLGLINVNLKIFFNNILFGVGPNNSFFSEFNKNLPLYVIFQPVHNIYLHILVQLGIFGGISLVMFLAKVYFRISKLIRKKSKIAFLISVLVIEVFLIGLFDHFLITLQQGMLMTALLFGLLFNHSLVRE